MGSPPFTALLVGLGRIGLGYDVDLDQDVPRQVVGSCATHARALTTNDAFRLIGSVDPDPRARETFGLLYDLPTWATLREVPDTRVDLVVIATPTEHHVRLATDAIRRWAPRMLLCEKPCAMSAREAERLASVAESMGTRVSVNYFRRYLPQTAEIGALISSPVAGQLVSGVVQYSHGLWVNGCHFVNLVTGWIGQPSSIRRVADVAPASGLTPSFVMSFENAGSVFFHGGAEGGLRLAEVSLAFSGGLLTYQLGGTNISWRARQRGPQSQPPRPDAQEWRDPLSSYQCDVYRHISRILIDGGPLVSGLDDAIMTLRLMEQVS
ncbi:MAG: Gfo/Idh/MocA family oxidoreductase [Candidatus Nanopelagicales bacterium]|nr:Gfo/Idh/MocA family oxidoreductase [Candidatus Nanopelagicales bacterium]MDZ4248956.1 Gfo/Idh/MocA family oxidoreductase [Candidatus Nanopelagicales bacterium]